MVGWLLECWLMVDLRLKTAVDFFLGVELELVDDRNDSNNFDSYAAGIVQK